MHYLAPPPSRTHQVELTTQESAQAMLSRYLEAARSHAALHPDAQLTDQGPVAAQGGGRLGLTLHNLGRIEAGLRGERIQADIPTAAAMAGEGEAEGEEEDESTGRAQGKANPGDEWMDKDVFEREQGEDEVLLREGPNEREDDDQEQEEEHQPDSRDPKSVVAEKKRKIGAATSVESAPVDKEARKKAKKERRKLEKASSEARRKATRD